MAQTPKTQQGDRPGKPAGQAEELASGPGAEKLERFAERVAQLLADRLAAHASGGDGRLASRDIQAVLNGFDAERDATLRGLCQSTWLQLQQQFEDAFYARLRKYPLERLIVDRFAHLLAPRGEAPVLGRTLSRRVIPAFIQALHQMVGPDLFDEYENRARDLIDNLRARQGGALDWDALPQQPTVRILVNDILIYIARYFLDVPKRRAWMISYFDRTMPAPKTEAERAWTFGDMEFHKLMSALYKELAETLFDEAGRQSLEQRYDPASLSQLEQMLAALAQDQRRLLKDGR
jgi:hypothetical protein